MFAYTFIIFLTNVRIYEHNETNTVKQPDTETSLPHRPSVWEASHGRFDRQEAERIYNMEVNIWDRKIMSRLVVGVILYSTITSGHIRFHAIFVR